MSSRRACPLFAAERRAQPAGAARPPSRPSTSLQQPKLLTKASWSPSTRPTETIRSVFWVREANSRRGLRAHARSRQGLQSGTNCCWSRPVRRQWLDSLRRAQCTGMRLRYLAQHAPPAPACRLHCHRRRPVCGPGLLPHRERPGPGQVDGQPGDGSGGCAATISARVW